MKKEIEISAKTKEEAIAEAVEKLGAPNEAALVITVISEGRKGFLGFGSVPATIHAVYQIPDAPVEPAEKPRHSRGDRGDRRRSDRPRRDPSDKTDKSGDKSGEKTEKADKPAEKPAPVREKVPSIDPSTATESEQMAYRFICKLVEDMHLEDVEIGMHPGHNDDMIITVDGHNAGVLIGHHGDTLDALQYLANLAANRKEEGEKREFARITVDVEDYRAKREEALRVLARKKAAQVLKYKKSIMLEPMNPYERRIIHSEIQGMEGVATNSIGVENNRRVVIYLEEEGMPTAGIKPAQKSGEHRSEKSHSRSRRRRSSHTNDPLAPLGENKHQPETSIFDGEEAKDPFEIDLDAATYQGDTAADDHEVADLLHSPEETKEEKSFEEIVHEATASDEGSDQA